MTTLLVIEIVRGISLEWRTAAPPTTKLMGHAIELWMPLAMAVERAFHREKLHYSLQWCLKCTFFRRIKDGIKQKHTVMDIQAKLDVCDFAKLPETSLIMYSGIHNKPRAVITEVVSANFDIPSSNWPVKNGQRGLSVMSLAESHLGWILKKAKEHKTL